jgi:hypothetical protein
MNFPPELFEIMVHLLVHIMDNIIDNPQAQGISVVAFDKY